MRSDVTKKWRERLPLLQARLSQTPDESGAWHWRAEVRVLRFLIRRYAAPASETSVAPAEICIEPLVEAPAPLSALERALLKMALLTPRVQNQHVRPSPRERTAILSRIQDAGAQAREISDEEDWRLKQFELASYFSILARQSSARQGDHEAQWRRRQRECEEARKRQQRARAWEERERKRRG